MSTLRFQIFVAMLIVINAGLYTLAQGQAAPAAPWTFKQPGAKQTLSIGLLVPLAPPRQDQGGAIFSGVKMAITDYAATLLPAYNFLVTPINTDCKAALSGPAAEKLVAQGVAAIIGDVCSSASLAVVAATAAKQVPVISPGSTSPALSVADHFFRTVPSDAFQGVALANLIKDSAAGGTVGVVFEDNAYGAGLVGKFTPAFAAGGGKVSAEYKFAPGKGDAQAAVDKLKAVKGLKAVLLVVNDQTFAADFLKKAAAAKLGVKIFGGDSLPGPSLITALAGATDVLAPVSAISTNPGKPSFRQAFDKFTNKAGFDPQAATAYDATVALMRAVSAAAPLRTNAALIAALQKTSFDGVTGAVAFDKNGDLVPNPSTYRVATFDPVTKSLAVKGA